jgi:hypothetical protein
MSPALALGGMIWTRHRLGLTILAAGWAVIIGLCRALPERALSTDPFETFFMLSFWVLFIGFIYLCGVFSFASGAMLEARESGFPSRLWPLPLPTPALVGWPFLWGAAVGAFAWLSLAWGYQPLFQAWQVQVPIGSLTLAAVVLLAWMQAITWWPLPLPGLRVFVLILLLSAAVTVPGLILEYDVPPAVWRSGLVALLPAAYGTAVAGVARARRGEVPHWNWPGWSAWLRWTSATAASPSFRSAARAHLWLEWRRVGLFYPLLIVAWSLFWLPTMPRLALFFDVAVGAGLKPVPPELLRELGSLVFVIATLLVFAPMLASALGPEMARLPGRNRSCVLGSFLATRPISTATLVRIKFEAAALSTLAGWGVLLIGLLLWLALGGHAGTVREQFESLRQRHAAGPFWVSLILLVLGSVVLTWLQMVKGMWWGLAGRARMMASSILGFAVLIGLVLLGTWLTRSPENWQRGADLLPWLTGVVIVLKIAASVGSLRALAQRRLVTVMALRGAVLIWGLLALALFAVLYWLLPQGVIPISALLLAIVVLLPLTRLALAPLALAWNRHR